MKICCFVVLCLIASEVLSQPAIPAFVPKRPTIDMLYYNDRATTGEIEAGPLEAQYFFLPDSTHLLLWTADHEVSEYNKLGFTTVSSPRYIVYNWHTGLPVAMCTSSVDYTDRYSKAFKQYELRMQYCKNPLELFCRPNELPEVVESGDYRYNHSFTKFGSEPFYADTYHKTDDWRSVALAEIGPYWDGHQGLPAKKIEFSNAIPYSTPAVCPRLPVCAVLVKAIGMGSSYMQARLEIYHMQTGDKISSLVNWREYQQYQADSLAIVEKAIQDSIEHAEKLAAERADLQRRKDLLPYFNIAAEKKLTAL